MGNGEEKEIIFILMTLIILFLNYRIIHSKVWLMFVQENHILLVK